MARPRFFRSEPKLQEAILSAATREFAAHGYAGASVNKILEEAGLSKGAFYYYFDDKADLAATALEAGLRDYIEALRALDLSKESAAGFWAGADALMRKSLEQLKRMPQSAELLVQLGSAMVHDSHLADHLAPLVQEGLDVLSTFWSYGQKTGEVRNDLTVEQLVAVLQGIKMALVRVLLKPGEIPSTEDLKRFAYLQMDLFRRVAEVRPAAAFKKTTRKKKEVRR